MQQLSEHILDIAQNSIHAKAKNICIEIIINTYQNSMRINIFDDGYGMDENFLLMVENPFTTQRTTRKVGMGIPLYKQVALQSGGSFEIKSQKNVGTKIYSSFVLDNIDRLPLGDMAGTMLILVIGNIDIDIVIDYKLDEYEYVFDTKVIKKVLQDEKLLLELEVQGWIKESLYEGLSKKVKV